MANTNLEDFMIKEATSSRDPVEMNIIVCVQRLRQQNKRLKDHIQKTGAWAQLKEVDLWKPFDFYHYFCSKYVTRYGVEYRQSGNIVLTYQRIDEFRLANHITKTEYKEFIDLAFEKYFNKITIPRIAHVCSVRLYNHLMGDAQFQTADEYHTLDSDLLSESEKFEAYAKKFNAV